MNAQIVDKKDATYYLNAITWLWGDAHPDDVRQANRAFEDIIDMDAIGIGIFDGNDLVGVFSYFRFSREWAFVSHLAVSRQKHGIGRFAMEWLFVKGLDERFHIRLYPTETSEAFYKRIGFTQKGVEMIRYYR
jgi:GNAT superfamily N-acetyltransferase